MQSNAGTYYAFEILSFKVSKKAVSIKNIPFFYRQEWKTMKVKKKAKWIKKAVENYREYEEKVAEFMVQNPGYVRPAQKNFLTQEEQRILDKFMGRPEKPPSSAYSLFSKEMLNNVEIKKFPSKDRMAQISEKWKLLPQEQKDK